MGYQPFTNDYSQNTAAIARVYARQAAKRARVNAQMTNGNQVMGALTTDCCSDPAYGGQSYYGSVSDGSALSSVVSTSGTAAAAAVNPTPGTAAPYPPQSFPLTPVDILTNTRGWAQQANGKPWPRLRLPRSEQRRRANAYPNYGPTVDMLSLVPPCPCFGSGPPVVMAVPPIVPAAPVAPQSNCPYPGCSTGNVCLDLVTGCVSNSQVTQAQVEACTLAGYSTFGNSGAWLSAILLGCGNDLPFLGAPLPNPPQASGSMAAVLTAANAAGVAASQKARGVSGLGQTGSTSPFGGFLAVAAMFGIVYWAMKQ